MVSPMEVLCVGGTFCGCGKEEEISSENWVKLWK
jgi:hypothetical protein